MCICWSFTHTHKQTKKCAFVGLSHTLTNKQKNVHLFVFHTHSQTNKKCAFVCLSHTLTNKKNVHLLVFHTHSQTNKKCAFFGLSDTLTNKKMCICWSFTHTHK